MGKEILESWNCFTLSRLHSAAGTVAVLMMLMLLARTRCRDAISWYICRSSIDSVCQPSNTSPGATNWQQAPAELLAWHAPLG